MQYCLITALLFPLWENDPTGGKRHNAGEFPMRLCGPHLGNSYRYKLLLFPTVGNKIENTQPTSCSVIEK